MLPAIFVHFAWYFLKIHSKLSHPELFYLCLYVTLGEVLYVGQLEVHFSQPHQDTVSCRFKLLSLADEVLREQNETINIS